MNKTIACPICGSDHLLKLYSIDSHYVIEHLINKTDADFQARCINKIEALWSDKKADFLVCKDCSFEFAHPFVSADAEFYTMIYHSETNYPADKWEYDITYQSLRSYVKEFNQSSRILEIGAGNGSFLKQCSDIILKSNMFSTEFSEAGMRSIEKLGIKCFRLDFCEISEQLIGGKVNIICLFQVMEHVNAIHELFKSINNLTSAGSRLYISVPNINHRKFYDNHRLYYDLPPIHVGRYNVKSMSRLSEMYSWKIIRHVIQPTLYTNRVKKFLFSKFAQWQETIHTEVINIRLLKLFSRYLLYSLIVVSNLSIIIGLVRKDLGTAQWFELEKNK